MIRNKCKTLIRRIDHWLYALNVCDSKRARRASLKAASLDDEGAGIGDTASVKVVITGSLATDVGVTRVVDVVVIVV
jgi:hypothetical protein